jgi:hypothetical protein
MMMTNPIPKRVKLAKTMDKKRRMPLDPVRILSRMLQSTM